ncbi:MAG: HTTM domain-containing protein [Gemmataceae bacterium]|nr:HTTM domain-containing protein [Gemmataceae bacterium]
MTDQRVVGLEPRLPWPLNRWPWWTEPVPAERLAALRIGAASVLLLDIATSYLPNADTFFGSGSLGDADAFALIRWRWSLLSGLREPAVLRWLLIVWGLAVVSLLLGSVTRLSAVAVWLLSLSFARINPGIENAGDEVRGILLFYLMLCPCGAVWSLDHRFRRRATDEPIFVWPWALRLLFVQMALIYFTNGLYKWLGEPWRGGDSVYYVLNDLTLTRWPYHQVPVPYGLTQLLTWLVLAWETGFPLLVALRWTRRATLALGVLFHLGLWMFLELGLFAPYMLCFYLPLVPWEQLSLRR